MKKLTKPIFFALSVLMAMSLAACGGSSSAAKGKGKVFVYGCDANSATFDPCSDLQTKSGAFLLNACAENLWTIKDDGTMNYVLATDVKWTGDLEMTITLRKGVKFSNGNDFTASDVIYSLRHMSSTGRTAPMFACIDFDATKTPDDNTVVLKLKKYDASFMDTLGNRNFCMLDEQTCTADPKFGWFIGTGPYMLAGDGKSDTSGWTESVQYKFVRNKLYWGNVPFYDELICKFFSEESTRFSEFKAGNLDAIYVSEATYIKNLSSGSVANAVLAQREMPSVYGFEFAVADGSNKAMADINVRKAFAHALDVETIVKTLGEDVYKVADSMLYPSSWAYKSEGVYKYDPAAAAEYLAKAGYSVQKPLTIKFIAESNAINSAIAEAAQSYLAKVGINLDLSGMGDFATILPSLLAGKPQASLGSSSNLAGTDPANLLQQMGPTSDNVLLRVTEPKLADLYRRGSSTKDHAERVKIYQAFQDGVHESYLCIPLWLETSNFGVQTKHANFKAALVDNWLNPCLLTD